MTHTTLHYALTGRGGDHAKLAYRIDEAAQALGLGRTSLYKLIGAGQLKAIKVAGRRLILKNDLEAFLASCCAVPEYEPTN